MNGLQRRYTLDEILEIKKGSAKVEPLNYDALRMLRDPLYVKMGQELRDQSSNMQAARYDDQEFKMILQRLASQRNVPLDQLEELLRNLLAKKKRQDPSDPMDTDDDDDMGGPPPRGGGGTIASRDASVKSGRSSGRDRVAGCQRGVAGILRPV